MSGFDQFAIYRQIQQRGCLDSAFQPTGRQIGAGEQGVVVATGRSTGWHGNSVGDIANFSCL